MESKKLIYADDARRAILKANPKLAYCIERIKTVDAIPIEEIEGYLQTRLNEWNALGDRKYDPANMWGYNFIMACFDDLGRRTNGEID